MRRQHKNLTEEIKRMKSLFTEERLYGNLVEQEEEIKIYKYPEGWSDLLRAAVINGVWYYDYKESDLKKGNIKDTNVKIVPISEEGNRDREGWDALQATYPDLVKEVNQLAAINAPEQNQEVTDTEVETDTEEVKGNPDKDGFYFLPDEYGPEVLYKLLNGDWYYAGKGMKDELSVENLANALSDGNIDGITQESNAQYIAKLNKLATAAGMETSTTKPKEDETKLIVIDDTDIGPIKRKKCKSIVNIKVKEYSKLGGEIQQQEYIGDMSIDPDKDLINKLEFCFNRFRDKKFIENRDAVDFRKKLFDVYSLTLDPTQEKVRKGVRGKIKQAVDTIPTKFDWFSVDPRVKIRHVEGAKFNIQADGWIVRKVDGKYEFLGKYKEWVEDILKGKAGDRSGRLIKVDEKTPYTTITDIDIEEVGKKLGKQIIKIRVKGN